MRILICALLLSSVVAFADEEAPTLKAKRARFEAGGYLQGGKPGTTSPSLGEDSTGIGLGYGLLFGWRAIPHLTLMGSVDSLYFGLNVPASTLDTAATVGLNVNVKGFPLGDSGPRFYGLLGVGFAAVVVDENVSLFYGRNTTGRSFVGYRFIFGAGYEFPITEHGMLFFEFALWRTSLEAETFDNRASRNLNPSSGSWTPLLRVGLMGVF